MLLIEHKFLSPKEVGLSRNSFYSIGTWNNLEQKFYPAYSYDSIKKDYEKWLCETFCTDYEFSPPVTLELLSFHKSKSVLFARFVQRKYGNKYDSILIHVYYR